MSAPTLTTPRLTLAAPASADLEESAAMWAAPAVYRAIGGRIFTREEVWHRLLRYIGHWEAVGYGGWTVRETTTGRYVGDVTLMDSRRATEPGFEGTPEVGWALAPWAHGRGFASEALAALFGWADPRLPRTICMIDPVNTRSIRLATRFGYRVLAKARYRDAPTVLFQRLAG